MNMEGPVVTEIRPTLETLQLQLSEGSGFSHMRSRSA